MTSTENNIVKKITIKSAMNLVWRSHDFLNVILINLIIDSSNCKNYCLDNIFLFLVISKNFKLNKE